MKMCGKTLGKMRDKLLKNGEIDALLVPAEPDENEEKRSFVLHNTELKVVAISRVRKGGVDNVKSAPGRKECSLESYITEFIQNSDTDHESSASDSDESTKKKKKSMAKGKKKKKSMNVDSDLAGAMAALDLMDDLDTVEEEDACGNVASSVMVKKVSESEMAEVAERILRVLARREAPSARKYARKHGAWLPKCIIDESEVGVLLIMHFFGPVEEVISVPSLY